MLFLNYWNYFKGIYAKRQPIFCTIFTLLAAVTENSCHDSGIDRCVRARHIAQIGLCVSTAMAGLIVRDKKIDEARATRRVDNQPSPQVDVFVYWTSRLIKSCVVYRTKTAIQFVYFIANYLMLYYRSYFTQSDPLNPLKVYSNQFDNTVLLSLYTLSPHSDNRLLNLKSTGRIK